MGLLEAGVLAVNKPPGPTSREMVNRVVRGLGMKRVGHAGTLDPFAEGLLLVVWGKATSLVPYLQRYSKTYRASARFGRITDTQDCTGTVLEENSVQELSREKVEKALPSFRGAILQVPPMYSALKKDGQRLYKLARQGAVVEREPRERVVERLELLSWDPPSAEFVVDCSTGTYIRTLVHDLGVAVGTGAMLDRLVRTAIARFDLETAVTGDRLLDMNREEILEAAVDPGDALPDWPEVTVPSEEISAVVHGSWVDPEGRVPVGGDYRLVDREGRLLALARGGPSPKLLRVFAERTNG